MHEQPRLSSVVLPLQTSVSLQIAGKVAAPLSRTNEIVILSGEGSRVTGEVNRLLAELPVSINALTGVDLTKVGVAGLHPRVVKSSLAAESPPLPPQVPLLQKMVGQTAI